MLGDFIMESPIDREGSISKGKNNAQYTGLDPKPTHMGDNGSATTSQNGLHSGSKGKDFKGR